MENVKLELVEQHLNVQLELVLIIQLQPPIQNVKIIYQDVLLMVLDVWQKQLVFKQLLKQLAQHQEQQLVDGLIVVLRNHVHHLEIINHYVRIQKLVMLILVFGKIIHV